MKKHFLAGGVLFAAFVLVAAACGSDSDDSADSTTTTSPAPATTTVAPAPTTEPPAQTVPPPVTTVRPPTTTAPPSEIQYPEPAPLLTAEDVIKLTGLVEGETAFETYTNNLRSSSLYEFSLMALFEKIGYTAHDIASASFTEDKQAELAQAYEDFQADPLFLEYLVCTSGIYADVRSLPSSGDRAEDYRQEAKFYRNVLGAEETRNRIKRTYECPGNIELNDLYVDTIEAVIGKTVPGCDYLELVENRSTAIAEISYGFNEQLMSQSELEQFGRDIIRCFDFGTHLAQNIIYNFGPFSSASETCLVSQITTGELGTKIIDFGIEVSKSRIANGTGGKSINNLDFEDRQQQLLDELKETCSPPPVPGSSAGASGVSADPNSELTDFTATCLEEHLDFSPSGESNDPIPTILGFCQIAEEVLSDEIPKFSEFEAICFAETFDTSGINGAAEARAEARKILYTYCSPLALTLEQIPNLTQAQSICMAELLNPGDYNNISSDTTAAAAKAVNHMFYSFRTHCSWHEEAATKFTSTCLEEVLDADDTVHVLNLDELFVALPEDDDIFYFDRLHEALEYCNLAEAKVNEIFKGTPDFAEFEAVCVASVLDIDQLREDFYTEGRGVPALVEKLVLYCSTLERYLERYYPDESPAQEVCFAEYLANVGRVSTDQGLTQLVAEGQAVIDRAAAGACQI